MAGRKKPIEPGQVKRIHVLISRMGISDEDYRARLEKEFGVRTCKALSRAQAARFIRTMEPLAPAPPRRRREWKRRPGMATPAQLRKIEAMWADVSKKTTVGGRRKALGAFLEKRFGVSDLAFVTHEMPGKIIHALEAMKQQARVSVLLFAWLLAAPAAALETTEAEEDLPAWRTCLPVTQAWRGSSSFRCNVDGQQIILVVEKGNHGKRVKWLPAGKIEKRGKE